MAIVVLGVTAVTWATTRVAVGLSADYFGLAVGSLLVLYHAGLASTILRQATRPRDPNAQWRHPIQLVVDYQYGSDKGRAVTLNFNEAELSILSRNRLPEGVPIKFTIKSPFTDSRCVGEVIGTKEQSDGQRRMYVHEIAFRNPDPTLRQAEKDAVTKLSFGYVVPWIITEHRGNQAGVDLRSRDAAVARTTPLPIEVNSPDAAMPDQSSVIEQMDWSGLVATLTYPLNENSIAEIVIQGPSEDITANARIANTQAIRVGTSTVYRHRFNWVGPTPAALPSVLCWMGQQYRRNKRFKNFGQKHHLLNSRNAAWATALAVIVLVTSSLFWTTHSNDRLLLAATERPLTQAELHRLEQINESALASRYSSVDRLLRMYQAALAVDNPRQAAEVAGQLAEQMPKQRYRWMATAASHWAQAGQYEQADKLFRQVIASGSDRFLSAQERAMIHIEAARVAIAVGDIERSASLFTKSGNLKSFGQEQIDEYIGLLVVAGKLPQAFRLLRQMGTSDHVLHQIVEVYEIAKQPQLAVSVLETLHTRNPEEKSVIQRLAELASERGDYEASIGYYLQLLQLSPNDSMVKRKLAGIESTLGRTDEAIALLRSMKDTKSLMLLVSILETTGHFNESMEQLRKVSDESIGTVDYQKQLIRLLLATKQYDKAVNHLVGQLELYPEDQGLWRDFINAVAGSQANLTDRHTSSDHTTSDHTTSDYTTSDYTTSGHAASGHTTPDHATSGHTASDYAASDHTANKTMVAQKSPARQMLGTIYSRYKTTHFQQLDLNALSQLAGALQRFDMASDAIEVLTFAVKTYPDSRPVRLQLAQALDEAGHYNEAEEQFILLLNNG